MKSVIPQPVVREVLSGKWEWSFLRTRHCKNTELSFGGSTRGRALARGTRRGYDSGIRIYPDHALYREVRRARVGKAGNYLVEKFCPKGGGQPIPEVLRMSAFQRRRISCSNCSGMICTLLIWQNHARSSRDLGGVAATNSFTRIYLAMFGQVPWEDCPAVPPEVILFPSWCPINLYALSSWSRCIIVPLSIIWAFKPFCSVPAHANLDDIRVDSVVVPTNTTRVLADVLQIRGCSLQVFRAPSFSTVPAESIKSL